MHCGDCTDAMNFVGARNGALLIVAGAQANEAILLIGGF
jgi:hypothetical protein